MTNWLPLQTHDVTSVCNPGIPAVFANPESRDWRCPNPEILGLQKFIKNVFLSVK